MSNILNTKNFKTKFINKFNCLLLAGSTLSTIDYSLAVERVNKITIEGNYRIEKSTIENYLGIKIGDEYTPALQNSAIKNLYSSYLFDDINISFNNGNMIVNVKEPSFITKVIFVGNSKISSKNLANEVISMAGESASKAKISADIQKIKEIYKRSGRFSAQVDARLEPQENNRAKLVFDIIEGPKTTIKNIYFVGNKNYTANELKTIIATKEHKWFKFLDTNDTYDPDRIEHDKNLLKNFYMSVGYADFRVISSTTELAQTKDRFDLTYSIEEGNKYNFGNITIENRLPHIDNKVFEKLITVKKEQLFNMSLLDNITDKISDYLSSLGYPQVRVTADTINDHQQLLVNTTIVIDKADKVFINKINIAGNLKTEDKVIRREFRIAEGDIFNLSYIQRGERNLNNLNYFEKVNVKMPPTEQRDRYDLNINVQEKSTSTIGFDVGYSTASGMFGKLSFVERNLVGTGKHLNTGVQVGKSSTYYHFGITEPYFLDKDLALGVNLFRNHSGKKSGFENANKNYTLDSTGATTSLSYEITEDLGHEVEYTIKESKLKADSLAGSRFIKEQVGRFTTSSIGQTFTYDKTDSRVLPKNGYIASISQEYAGLGGQNKYLKHEIESKFFKSFFNNKLTFKVAASAGQINGMSGKYVRISDRFNLGDYSLRGFASGGIGPRDKQTQEGLGGQTYYSITTELNFPVGAPEEFDLTGAAFIDMGSVFDVKFNPKNDYTSDQYYNDKDLRIAGGFGILWVTKVAPIRVDWALPIKRKKYDDTQRFHIRFSTHF